MGLCVALVTLPGWLPMLFLDPVVSNTPLFALFALPFGPALAAGVHTYERREGAEDLTPVRYFLQGWRRTLVGALALWGIALAVLALLLVFAGNAGALGLGWWYVAAVLVAAAAIAVWTFQATGLLALTTLSWRDALRVSIGLAPHAPATTLGVLTIVLANLLVVTMTFEAVLVLLGWLTARLLHLVVDPYLDATDLPRPDKDLP